MARIAIVLEAGYLGALDAGAVGKFLLGQCGQITPVPEARQLDHLVAMVFDCSSVVHPACRVCIIPLMRVRAAILVLLSQFVMVPSVSAWDCPAGVPDTKANQEAGICVEKEPTPKKKQHRPAKPTVSVPTPVPTVAIPSTPTIPATSVPLASTPTPAAPSSLPTLFGSLPFEPLSEKPPGQMCVYEPTTKQWEIRNHWGDHLEANQRWPIERDLCEQDREVLPVRTSTPVPPAVTSLPTPQPVVLTGPTPETLIGEPYACVNSELLVLIGTDDQTGLPMWLIYGDNSGVVMVGEQCPIGTPHEPEGTLPPVDIEAPRVPVQVP